MDYKQTADVLEEALRFIDERGWTQHSSVNDEGNVCVGQALSLAGKHLGHHIGLPVCFLEEYTGWPSISYWNDAYHRTLDDIKTTLKDAAQEARSMGA